MEIYDLSLPLEENSTPVPGHPRVTFNSITTHEENGRLNTSILTSLHTSTHVDSPYHFFEGRTTIDKLSLDKLVTRGSIIDLRKYVSGPVGITKEMLVNSSVDMELFNRAVILFTGWCEKHYYDADFYDVHPYLTKEGAEWLVEKKIRAVCFDFPPDQPYIGAPVPGDAVIHETFLGNDIPHIENLVDIEPLLGKEFILIAAPVKVKNGDGAPSRVIAIVDTELPNW
ncbi:MAG: cyclase family protein [Desulfitobacteriaceae bacterium]